MSSPAYCAWSYDDGMSSYWATVTIVNSVIGAEAKYGDGSVYASVDIIDEFSQTLLSRNINVGDSRTISWTHVGTPPDRPQFTLEAVAFCSGSAGAETKKTLDQSHADEFAHASVTGNVFDLSQEYREGKSRKIADLENKKTDGKTRTTGGDLTFSFTPTPPYINVWSGSAKTSETDKSAPASATGSEGSLSRAVNVSKSFTIPCDGTTRYIQGRIVSDTETQVSGKRVLFGQMDAEASSEIDVTQFVITKS